MSLERSKQGLHACARHFVLAGVALAICLTAMAQDAGLTIGDGDAALLSESAEVVVAGRANAPAGSLVVIAIGDHKAEARVGENGEWSLAWPAPLAGGSYVVIASLTDADGRTLVIVIGIEQRAALGRARLMIEAERRALIGHIKRS